MAIRWQHDDSCTMYFVTFTCFRWISLIDITHSYDLVYNKWFDYLKERNHYVSVFVIMPNHLHAILYFPEPGFNLNTIIGNAKRFMAYEIIKRLEKLQRNDLLILLTEAVTKRESKKGQLHKVFEESFDAKGIRTEKFFNQKINYIHQNPIRGKWQLVADYTDYEHSSASFYDTGIVKRYRPFDFRLL